MEQEVGPRPEPRQHPQLHSHQRPVGLPLQAALGARSREARLRFLFPCLRPCLSGHPSRHHANDWIVWQKRQQAPRHAGLPLRPWQAARDYQNEHHLWAARSPPQPELEDAQAVPSVQVPPQRQHSQRAPFRGVGRNSGAVLPELGFGLASRIEETHTHLRCHRCPPNLSNRRMRDSYDKAHPRAEAG